MIILLSRAGHLVHAYHWLFGTWAAYFAIVAFITILRRTHRRALPVPDAVHPLRAVDMTAKAGGLDLKMREMSLAVRLSDLCALRNRVWSENPTKGRDQVILVKVVRCEGDEALDGDGVALRRDWCLACNQARAVVAATGVCVPCALARRLSSA